MNFVGCFGSYVRARAYLLVVKELHTCDFLNDRPVLVASSVLDVLDDGQGIR